MRVMRWNCLTQGCYRTLCPKLGTFDDCFPGRIGMSDVDGIVEIAGRFLLLEWKSEGGYLTDGQRIMFERMTAESHKWTVIVVQGDPRDMAVETVQVFHGGRAGPVEPTDLEGLKERMAAWSARVREARTRPSRRGVPA